MPTTAKSRPGCSLQPEIYPILPPAWQEPPTRKSSSTSQPALEQEAGNRSGVQDSKAGHLMWHIGVCSIVIAAVPNVHPRILEICKCNKEFLLQKHKLEKQLHEVDTLNKLYFDNHLMIHLKMSVCTS